MLTESQWEGGERKPYSLYFLIYKGLICHKFVAVGLTVNAAFYLEVLKKLE